MKTSFSLFMLIALGLVAGCGDDEKKPNATAGSGGEPLGPRDAGGEAQLPGVFLVMPLEPCSTS